MSTKTTRICLWSGPRNISTAMMYSFAQRSDTAVFDEPLYAHYLSKSPARAYHPGADEVIASMENDGEKVVRDLILAPHEKPVLFFKMMTHHLLVELDWGFMDHTINIILIRNPIEMLPSYAKQVNTPTIDDVGYAFNVRLYNYLQSRSQQPIVLDAAQTLINPRRVLSQLCTQIGIPFEDAMLTWQAGARPEDGTWAKYWYHAVHRSTGFRPYRPKSDPFPEHLRPLLAECMPYYEELARLALTP